jgi:predicted outer membrane repeat protein
VDAVDADTTLRRVAFTANGADGTFAFGAVSAAGASLVVEDCAFTGNQAGDGRSGGAILSAAADTVIVRSAFTGNSAGSWSFFGQGGAGGAIAWGAPGPGTLRIEDSTFSGNDASFGGAVAVWRGDLDPADTVATISGSTFAGNTASDAGAHLWLGSAGELTATGGALSAADAEAGGIVAVGAGTLRLSGSAVDGDPAAAVVDPWSDAPPAWFPVPGAADVDLCVDADGPC